MSVKRKSKVELENHRMALRRTRQSCVQQSQRKAFTEIGNVVRRDDSVSSLFTKDEKKPLNVERRSTRASVAMSSRLTLKPEDNQPRLLRSRTSQIGSEVPSEGFVKPSIPQMKGKSLIAEAPRRPRLTLKPPAVNTPPAERLAAEMKLRASYVDVKTQFLEDQGQSAGQHSAAPDSQPLPSAGIPPQPEAENIEKRPAAHTKQNIDQQHRHCPWMVSNYVERVYVYLQKLDRMNLIAGCILPVTENARTGMVDWLASRCHMLHLLQETFQLSVSILDRFLVSVNTISDEKLKLVAVTCLSLSVKYEEIIPVSVKDLLSLAGIAYSLREVLNMEWEIMEKLEFQVASPVPIAFLRRYNLAARCGREQHTFGKYLIDLAQMDWQLTRQGASPVAAATVFVATCIAKSEVDSSHWNLVLRQYTKLTYDDIKPLASRMAMAAIEGGGQFSAVKRKYASESLYKVSEKIELHHSILRKLSLT